MVVLKGILHRELKTCLFVVIYHTYTVFDIAYLKLAVALTARPEHIVSRTAQRYTVPQHIR